MRPLIITNPVNIEYLTNFTGSFGILILTDKKNYLCTDARYKEVVKTLREGRIKFEFLLVDEKWKENIHSILKNYTKIGVEGDHMTMSRLSSYKKIVQDSEFVPLEGEIEKLRSIKDVQEISKIIKAQDIIDNVFHQIKMNLTLGMSELDIAWLIKSYCHATGAQDISFEPIVAFGDHSASPHHQNTNRKLKKGDMIMIDHGAKYKGYCSDMTRMIFTKKPTLKEMTIYNLVLDAQKAGIKKIKAGKKASEIDHASRKVIDEKGYGEYFTHSLGHGVGLDVHDGNLSLSKRSKDVLKENMVVTVEPGIYLPGEFGVRIEDMGLVTKNGFENFTKSPKSIEESIKQL